MSELQAFHEVRFPVAISFGATGGPARRNEIVRLTSGHERRNARLGDSRRSYDAGTGLRSLGDVHDVVAFFEARRGSLHGFRFRDPFDWRSGRPDDPPSPLDQAIGAGDGATAVFQLTKTYGAGADAYVRTIAKPEAGSVVVAVAGAMRSEGTHFSLDAATGRITFLAGHVPAAGAAVTAGFAFDVPVRFDAEQLSVSLAGFRAGQIPSIPLIEILP
jgi:uncharacterized protein (TIGR02217 family)